MATSTAEILNRGMRCLTEQMGIVEAEHFISAIIREKFDYTKWQNVLQILLYFSPPRRDIHAVISISPIKVVSSALPCAGKGCQKEEDLRA